MNKTLTVSIAAYNVEQYLAQTLDSFLAQDILDEIEVLIVDDGSKDSTARIAAEYEKRYPGTFRLLSKQNGGHGSTINTGIQHATGRYFKIVDGDDWVNTSDFAGLVKSLRNVDSDIVACHYVEVDEGTGKETPILFKGVEYGVEADYDSMLQKTELYMHQITMKTKILQDNHITMDEHCFYVDTEYIILPIPFLHTITFLDLRVYMYRVGQMTQSVSKQGRIRHIEDHVKVTKRLTEYAESEVVRRLSDIKKGYIQCFASQMVRTTLGIYLSFPFRDRTVRRRLSAFDRDIRALSATVYDYSKTTIQFPLDMEGDKIRPGRKTVGDKRINLLRSTNFFGWRLSQLFVDLFKRTRE